MLQLSLRVLNAIYSADVDAAAAAEFAAASVAAATAAAASDVASTDVAAGSDVASGSADVCGVNFLLPVAV